MKNTRKEVLRALNSITQLGVSVMISFLLWIMIASWLQKKFNLGNYVMLLGVILGTGSGVLSFIKFCKEAGRKENKNEK